LAVSEEFWQYKRVKVLRVIDGDTVELEIDTGFRNKHTDVFRVYGIDAPETRGKTKEAGIDAKEFLGVFLKLSQLSFVNTFKDKSDKYGRILAQIFVVDHRDQKISEVGAVMVKAGHAVPYFGGARPK
jgi:micrococcal nuclease